MWLRRCSVSWSSCNAICRGAGGHINCPQFIPSVFPYLLWLIVIETHRKLHHSLINQNQSVVMSRLTCQTSSQRISMQRSLTLRMRSFFLVSSNPVYSWVRMEHDIFSTWATRFLCPVLHPFVKVALPFGKWTSMKNSISLCMMGSDSSWHQTWLLLVADLKGV